ncbi:unnamed protein product [Dovyalis caffra]|uniref:Uncharacterized protein n=1 Tax=Dovyalis caffra TaxID=77055 RepID=A0AAV1RRJ5_9ROSI|nr:unnamed protein product [Dovyalis caffra]
MQEDIMKLENLYEQLSNLNSRLNNMIASGPLASASVIWTSVVARPNMAEALIGGSIVSAVIILLINKLAAPEIIIGSYKRRKLDDDSKFTEKRQITT